MPFGYTGVIAATNFQVLDAIFRKKQWSTVFASAQSRDLPGIPLLPRSKCACP